MQASSDLLTALSNKLKTANVRSPYLNAIIGRARNRVDLTSLNLLGENRSQEFLTDLLNPESGGAVSIRVDAASAPLKDATEEERFSADVLLKRMQALYFEQQSDFSEQGTHSFGFGYPLLAFTSRQDKTRLILAPLLIWTLKISPLENNHHAYTIQRRPGDAVVLNPQLVNYLWQDAGIHLEGIPEDFLEDDLLSREEVLEMMRKVEQLFPAEEVGFNASPESIKDKAYYMRLCGNNSLWFNSGLFAPFKSSKESIVADYEAMLSGKNDLLFDDPNLYQPYQDYFFTSVNLDPSQEGILRNISDHKKVIIQGPPGTGKSNSLTGIIINALENKASVLVVCEKRTALEVILENLSEKGLEDFCAVVDNIHSDRQNLVKRMREKLDDRAYEGGSVQGLDEYKNTKERHKEVYERASAAYGNLLEEVLGDLSWKACIGNFLKSLRESGNTETLSLVPNGYAWNSEEFFALLNAVEESAWRMEQALEVIHLFKDVKDELIQAEWTTAEFQNWNSKLAQWATQTTEILREWEAFSNSAKQPDRFLKPGMGMRLMALIQKPVKNALREAEKLLSDSITLSEQIGKDIQIPEKTAPLAQVWKKNLQQLSEKVRDMANVGSAFREYKTWKKHYLEQPQLTRQLLEALQQRPPKTWTTSFRAWYMNALLLQKEQDLGIFPTDSRNLEQLVTLEDKMGDAQLLSIREVWHEKQREQMRGRTLQQMRLLFNLRANKTYGARNSLRTLYHDYFDLLTAFFPVVLINPSVCSAMLPLKQGLFDLVIFDEASQLKLEDTFPALLRGRFKVISGDIHQMPPATHFASANTPTSALEEVEEDIVFSEEESLLTYAQNADFEFNYLDFHYRSRHPHLIEFSNAAFYGKRLVAMPPSIETPPIEMREVNGIYSDNTNPGEAKEILKILFEELTPDENGEWPSVGIATLNMSQQRFLWEQIWDYTDGNPDARSRLAGLEASGFFIKNLENIQGDQRDVIILSTTFGRREDGSFLQNFGPLNRDKGYKMLNVIVTRARDKMIIITSVPSEFYTNYRDDIITKGNTGKGIFYAYLNYARHCSDGNESARLELLNFLSENQGDKSAPPPSVSNFLTESVFEEEVLHYILEEIPADRVQTQFQLGGFRLDIVVLDNLGEPQLVIECDGKKYHKSKVAHRYDIHRQRILERYGLVVYRIWSTNWWRDREGEFRKLRTEIKRVCDL